MRKKSSAIGLTGKLSEIMIPTETVFEMRQGKKRTREKTFFPGYILIQAILDNELQHVIANVPSVVGFLTTGDQPTPLRPDEMNRILGKVDEAREMGEQPEIPFKAGDAIKVVGRSVQQFYGFCRGSIPR